MSARKHGVFSARFLVLFATTGYALVGLTAMVLALSNYVPYDESPRRAIGSGLALLCGGTMLGFGLMPWLSWARIAALNASRRYHR